MAHFVYFNSYLSLGGTDVSSHLRSLQADHSQDTPDDPVMGDIFMSRLAGVRDYGVTPVFSDDYETGDLDEDIDALWGTTFTVAWRPDAGVRSASNPEYQFTGVLSSDQAGGAFGDAAVRTLGAIMIASGVVTRAVT